MNKQAYKLLHKGQLALADVEANGIRIDTEYCQQQQKKIDKKIKKLESQIIESKEYCIWKKHYKEKTNIESNPQLSIILFKKLKLTPKKETAKGNPSVDKGSLESIKLPFVQHLIQLRKWKKLNNTYLKNIMEETVNGYIHPSFNLHTVKTFRSSSDRPNFQNMPIRDKEMGKIIRQAFIPRKDYLFGGFDYVGIEVRIAACYHKDPTMLKYIEDPTKDMHRDMAMQCYMLEENDVSKDARYCAKNKFVFPQFYGSWYEPCAYSLWNAISEMNLATLSGIPLQEHLRNNGIKDGETFQGHIKLVEDKFWNETFTGYRDWKKEWLKEYDKKGYFDTLTGFRCQGAMKRNDIINYPVQGVAFHCLLWALIKINKWLKKNKMKSMIVGQIHDEITMDIYKKEFDEVLKKVKKIMCKDIRKEWPWIITPLDIEGEFSDTNWYEKKEVEV